MFIELQQLIPSYGVPGAPMLKNEIEKQVTVEMWFYHRLIGEKETELTASEILKAQYGDNWIPHFHQAVNNLEQMVIYGLLYRNHKSVLLLDDISSAEDVVILSVKKIGCSESEKV